MDTDYKNEYILSEQVKKSYAQTTLGVVATLINALVLFFILMPVVSREALSEWIILLFAVSILRIVLKYRYTRASRASVDTVKWKYLLVFSMVLGGSFWGAVGAFLFPVDSIPHQVFIAFVVGGMVAGSMGMYSIILSTFLAFSLPAMAPIIGRFFYIGGEMYTSMAAMLLLFWLLMWFSARRLYRTTKTSISLQFDNTELIDELRLEIGERKKAARELLENQKRIESIVEERTVALKDAVQRLSLEIEGRKKTARALRESKEKYRILVENINDVIYAVDGDMRISYVSPTIEPVLGYRPAEIVGVRYTQLFHREDFDRGTSRFSQVLSGNIEPQEYRVLKKSGSYCWVRVSSRPIFQDGVAIGIQGVLSDITDRKLLEAKLKQAHKMEAIGTLAGGVAHDLNNILSGLVSYPQLVLMDLPEDSPLRNSILTIQKSGEKAAAIVQDLLTLARRGVPSMETIALNEVVEEYLGSPEHQNLVFNHPAIEFVVNLEPHLLNLWGSRFHLSKTIMNLVTNAAESILDGGKVIIESENLYVDTPMVGPLALAEGDFTVLRVIDDGNGILPEEINKIFEPFYTKKAMGRSGTGLGMAVIWNTVQDHKGQIEVQSEPGHGATFTLYFPATDKVRVKNAVGIDMDALRGKGESVLVVDDIKEQRDIASGLLKKLGYAVTTVTSGEEAVACLGNRNFDLLLLDMIMASGMDGFETYQKAVVLHPGQKAIIVSGFSETHRVRQAQRLGAGTYLKKPYLLENLGRAVRKELG